MPFEETGREIIDKFRASFDKLKKFMDRIEVDMKKFEIFNKKDEEFDDPTSKVSSINSVSQLKHLLRNYDALVDS